MEYLRKIEILPKRKQDMQFMHRRKERDPARDKTSNQLPQQEIGGIYKVPTFRETPTETLADSTRTGRNRNLN